MATIRTKPIYRFYEFASPFRMERREDGSEVLVQPGYAFVNETVPGDRYSLKRSAMQAATDGYREWEALREMHQPMAAGFVPKLEWDERGAYIEAHVVDPVAQQKVRTGTYKGFSVGVTPTLVNRANEVESCEWVEISLVDRPKDPHAVFTLARVENLDPDAEVDVEVVEDGPTGVTPSPLHPFTPSVEASPAAPEAAAVPDGDLISSTPSSAASEVTPVVPDPEAAGASSHTEEPQRGDASRLWAMLAADVPDETSETERRALVVEHLLAYGVAEPIAADMAARVDVMRALDSTKVPVRENLEGKKKPGYRDDVPLDERYIKQEGEKWCVYSESGEKLGEHDTRAEAVEQLQAMEVSTDKKRAAAVAPDRVEIITRELEGILDRAIELQRELVDGTPAADPAPEPAVEATPPAAPETVSRADARNDVQRLETVTAELSRVQVALEAEQTLRATAEAEVRRLGSLPLERRNPPVRFAAALTREFLANAEAGAGDDVAMMRKLFDKATEEAQAETDPKAKNQAIQRMLLYKEGLREAGVTV